MTMPWLTVLWLLPAVASAVVMFLPAERAHNAKVIGIGASLLVLAWSVVLAVRFDTGGGRFQMTEDLSWIPQFGARYSLGLDGVGLALILLTTVLTPLLLLAGWRDADGGDRRGKSVHIYVALLLAVEAMVLMSFVATDVLLFYIFFEAMLIPMYFLIGGFGPEGPGAAPERSRAAVRFLLYNLFGGLIMLAAVIGLYAVAGQFSLESISRSMADGTLDMSPTTQNLLFGGFVFAFAVKAPVWPLHTWLPDAAVSTTPAAAVMMMAVMDKVGTFAMLRFCLGLFPDASETFAPVLCTFAVISIVYGAVMAIGQRDVMRLIAYTSISHFGFIVLGVFALTDQGQTGSTLYMVNHGVSTAALFLVAGFLVSRRGSSLISDFGGVQRLAPVLAGTFLIAGLATLSLPGLGPFISEFLVLIGTFVRYPAAAVVASIALVLSAVYILWTYQRMMGGPPPDDPDGRVTDLGVREKLVLAPLIVALFVLGFFPRIILDFVDPATAPDTSTTAVQGGDR
ncbi:NADH-quinone oxidoreductase subunit M [Gordonia spumicola]|uniref:NADH-quinone oxidoreductase subunit M n=1 Tax=Gordonia spumicola TaxID=589161 RepID=A0A7I9VB33_9ACTN|nr:NADH-quinone oxidoreductase subunit M [Gordonia spumicola]GEE02303.1 NADH-quinone oxidoreductase subunit M [Gordonia spumicola]